VGFASGASGVSVDIEQSHGPRKAACDCLIGADGLHSFVRQRLGAGNAVKFSGKTAWRAIIHASCVPAGMRQEETTLWLGRKAHLVHYPLRGGTIINVVAIVDEEFCAGEAVWSSPGQPEFLAARFAGWDEAAMGLLRAAPDWRKWPLFDSRPIASWAAGRVALMGDAAHPMLPFLAQGAAQAIEDAAALGRALGGSRNIEASLCAYQEARRARAALVQRMSRKQAAIYHLAGPAAFLRDAAMHVLGSQKLIARYNWLYDARKREHM
jgi:salicylate hydroxylase